jgi:hypothetical protein
MILQNRHYRLLEEYITKGDDYADWFQRATVEESEKFQKMFCSCAYI